MKDKITTTAKVQLTIEIDSLGSWGADCTADQVFRQSKEAAINRLRNAFGAIKYGVRLVEEPTVTMVTSKYE